jgi:hypothetical protein
MAKKRTRTRRKKARPLLVAAVGAALLIMGCEETTSGNLIAPPQDLSVPDLSKKD